MTDILERHQRIGQILAATFSANDGPIIDWAEIGFEIRDMQKSLNIARAKIDQLMLEYCPDEMTTEQLDEWSKHQVPVSESEFKEFISALGYREE